MATPRNDPQRLLGRTVHVDVDTGLAYIELRNGNHIYIPVDDDELAAGDVVLIGPNWDDFEVVPSELWREEPWVGVVKLVTSDKAVVNVGGNLRIFPHPDGIALKKDCTVEGTDKQGIKQVLSDDPIRTLDISINEAVTVDQFKSSPKESPSLDDFGGYPEIVDRARELIEVPLKHHDILRKIGTKPIRGVLFAGEPGTGKTMLARIIANQVGAEFYLISGPEVLSKWFGQSEDLIRQIFTDATKQPRAVIVFDEIDSLAGQRSDASHEASRRIVGQLLTSIDGFHENENVIVVATTNRPEDIDVALRRPGRLDWEIYFPRPSRSDREAIIAKTAPPGLGETFSYSAVADKTEGWLPAELDAIWREAGLLTARDERDTILEEDYIGGYERVAAQRALIAANKKPQAQKDDK